MKDDAKPLSLQSHEGLDGIDERYHIKGKDLHLLLLEVKGLQTFFKSADGPIRAVDGVDLSLHNGETVALVGESGCGKSIFSLSLARLVPRPGYHPAGKILFNGVDVLGMTDHQLTELRGGAISYVFQEPGSALNPVFRVGSQIAEA
ncbi:MAG: ATP-binding cassette domain-containing protein, partial [bacterium]